MASKKRPTQGDVARVAGVSRATVSFVLNNTGAGAISVSPETRQKVVEAARQLNYLPDPVAQMLASGSNHLIGVFTYEPDFPFERTDFYYDFLLGIETGAARSDLDVILFTRAGEPDRPRLIYGPAGNRLRLADGAIFLGANPDRAELARLTDEGYPFVFIGRRDVPGREISWVTIDYASASAQATRHLLEAGHRDIAYVGSDTNAESNQDKLIGIRDAVRDVADARIHILSEAVLGDAVAYAAALREPFCSAVLCSHATTFDITLDALESVGLRVPAEISVISLADTTRVVGGGRVHTHVNVDRRAWGEQAVRSLVRMIREETTEPIQVRMPYTFVVGETTAPRQTCRNVFRGQKAR